MDSSIPKGNWCKSDDPKSPSLGETLASQDTIASYYNPQKECKLLVDACNKLLELFDARKDTPMCYTSKTLNEREKKYTLYN